MGADIIGAISSGFGLVPLMAKEFLDAFTALVYPTTGSTAALSPLAIFAFVMLGVSISFSCINKALGMLRGNTGA